jgi:hypothetical protein
VTAFTRAPAEKSEQASGVERRGDLVVFGIIGRIESGSQRGGFSSPASQPVASVFNGSTAKQTFSMRWQVLHSKVRSS